MKNYLKYFKNTIFGNSKKSYVIVNSFFVGKILENRDAIMFLYEIIVEGNIVWILIVDDELLTLKILEKFTQIIDGYEYSTFLLYNDSEEINYNLKISENPNYNNTINDKPLTKTDKYFDENTNTNIVIKKKIQSHISMISSVTTIL